MTKYIKAHNLKEVIQGTLSFITWTGSVQSKWNKYISALDSIMDNSFFINGSKEYECGWYVDVIYVKEFCEQLRRKIEEETNYLDCSYLMEKFNIIVSHVNREATSYLDCSYLIENVNREADSQLVTEAKPCENEYCLYARSGFCCNKIQHIETANAELDCPIAIRSDYDAMMRSLRESVRSKIEYMSMEELLKIMSMEEK